MIAPHVPPAIVRLRITPDDHAVDAPAGERPIPGSVTTRRKGSRYPHADATVAAARRLIEGTTLTYAQIEARLGVGHTNLNRWARDGKWIRPLLAARATGSVPGKRAGRRRKLRLLAAALLALAERHVRELETAPAVETDALISALQVVKMARLEAMGRRRPGPRGTRAAREDRYTEPASPQDAVPHALREMERCGVDIISAPKRAVDLVIEAHTPREPPMPELRPRGHRSRRNAHHAWMLEKE